jgi:hypothetical protein
LLLLHDRDSDLSKFLIVHTQRLNHGE